MRKREESVGSMRGHCNFFPSLCAVISHNQEYHSENKLVTIIITTFSLYDYITVHHILKISENSISAPLFISIYLGLCLCTWLTSQISFRKDTYK